jgi:hypothetical protein
MLSPKNHLRPEFIYEKVRNCIDLHSVIGDCGCGSNDSNHPPSHRAHAGADDKRADAKE